MPNNTRPEDRSIPDEFLMNSRVIYISNFTEIPEDIDEKVLAIQLNYTTSQAYNILDNRLEELLPDLVDLSLEDKKEIIVFLKEHKRLSDITLKDFIHVAVIWKSDDTNKEAWALEQIKDVSTTIE